MPRFARLGRFAQLGRFATFLFLHHKWGSTPHNEERLAVLSQVATLPFSSFTTNGAQKGKNSHRSVLNNHSSDRYVVLRFGGKLNKEEESYM